MDGPDTRGFSYALEPVQRRREWKLDAALARLAKLNQQLRERQAAREAILQDREQQAVRVSRAWTARPDPVAQTQLLAYLAALHRRAQEADQEIAALTDTLLRARQECAAQRQGLEVLDEHRAGLLKDYGTEQLRKTGVHADQEWVARERQL
jgi:hypothetical protein